MKPIVCGFVGLGLIGGSIAKALKEKYDKITIYAYDTNKDSLATANQEGIVDHPMEEIGKEFHNCDIIFLCAPVSSNDLNLKTLSQYISENCILTDVGSVKTPIHETIASLGLTSHFIGGHPMAGSERYGYINSKAALLENAYYILTPTKEVSTERIDFYKEMVKRIGAIPLILSCEKHDYITAGISHLPHVIAAALVNLVHDSDSEDGIMKLVAAGGFKDITRIASSSSEMWQHICLTNTENILALLDQYQEALSKIRTELSNRSGDAIYDFFANARIYRDSFIEASSGPIKKVFSLHVDIPDEPGALASIATMLALNNISIKNIGIAHNREFEEGVLQIEFYEENGLQKAISLLTSHGYVLHTKN